MRRKSKPTHSEKILRQAGRSVKSRIILSGIRMEDLAKTSHYSRATLSHLLYGRSRSMNAQIAVWRGYKQLTSEQITLREFWGDLLSPNVAEDVVSEGSD